jgi:hypothetical protein
MNQLASITNFCSSVADIPRLLDPDNSFELKHSPEKTLSQPSHVTKPSSDPVEPKPPAEPPDVTKPSYDPTPAISLPPYRLATAGLPNLPPDSTFPVPECRGNDSAIQRNMFCNENREIISPALLAPPPSGASNVNQLASITNFCSFVADIPRPLDPDNSLEPKHSPEKTLSQPSHVTKTSSDPIETKLPAEPP